MGVIVLSNEEHPEAGDTLLRLVLGLEVWLHMMLVGERLITHGADESLALVSAQVMSQS